VGLSGQITILRLRLPTAGTVARRTWTDRRHGSGQSSARGRSASLPVGSKIASKRRPTARGSEYCVSGRAGDAEPGKSITTVAANGKATKCKQYVNHLPDITISYHLVIKVITSRICGLLIWLVTLFGFYLVQRPSSCGHFRELSECQQGASIIINRLGVFFVGRGTGVAMQRPASLTDAFLSPDATSGW
jgi:hypothetical protein